MKRGKENMNLGLTKDEFELVINNSHNPELIKGYIDKLDNCDLSKSAIELIREEDLAAVNRITNEISLKYPTISNTNSSIKILIGSITLIILVIGFIFLQKKKSDYIVANKPLTNQEDSDNKEVQKDNTKKSEAYIHVSENEKSDLSKILDSNKSTIAKSDSLTSLIDKTLNNLPSSTTKQKSTIDTNKKSKKNNSKFTNNIYERKVRAIKSLKQVPNKYKNEAYSTNDLVDFYGGNKNLEKELLTKLKGKIKDTHIPKKNTSIVFKFSVTSNGKIKDINIQSLVNIELEEIIKETALNLTTWTKGSKRIPVIYTVYITFK